MARARCVGLVSPRKLRPLLQFRQRWTEMQAAQTPPTNARKDTQIVELAGRNRLASELQRAGIEVARPERDRGVDLLAYLDRDDKFCARPIQMKASSREAFGVQ